MTPLSIQYSPTFIRRYKRLPVLLQPEVNEKISLFQNPSNHELLHVHKLKNLKNTYAFSVNYQTRIVFQYESKQIVGLLFVGLHDEVY